MIDEELQRHLVKSCGIPKRYLSAYSDEGVGDGLYIVGSVGVGKTYMASGIAIRMADRRECREIIFTDTTSFYSNIRASFNGDTVSPLQACKEAGLLVLDDVDKAAPTRWTMQVLYELVNHRYNMELPTIYTANCRIGELGSRMCSITGDKVTAQAIVSRIRESVRVITMEGKDRRPTRG